MQAAFNLSRYLQYLDYFLLKYLKYMLFGVVFLTYQKGDKRVCFNSKIYVLVFLCTKVVRHIFVILLKFTRHTGMVRVRKITPVVIRKMRSAGLYSTARYGLSFEQYIDGYIINNLFQIFQTVKQVYWVYIIIGSACTYVHGICESIIAYCLTISS